VQLLLHAYRIGDLRTLHELEGMSRQEMRHFKWLSEMIVSLGGNPTLERAPLFLEPAAPAIWLGRDVALAEAAIARYELGRETAATPELARLYARLLDDEQDHRRKLIDLVAYWQERPEPVAPLELDHQGEHASDPPTRGFLDFAIKHEYAVILQYLHHAFLLEDQFASRTLEEIAIEEMRHLGWLSEKLIDRGGIPAWEPDRLELTEDPIEMLQLDQARELEVEADYQQMTAAMADPEIKRLFDRIGAHEAYHAGVIGELIQRLEAAQAAKPTPAGRCPIHPYLATVGSMLGERQS
jgi:bacterioferritin